MDGGTLTGAAGPLTAGHAGQTEVAGAATYLDCLVGERKRRVKEVNIRCGSLVVCTVLLKSTLVGGVAWNVFFTITWTIQLVVCVAFENSH